MRDYYAELGLNFGASSQDILAAVTAHPQNQEAANVLLNPLKKQVYDQAYFSLHEIGMLRAALGTQSPYWVQEQASFVRTEKQGKSIRTCKQLRRSGRLFWLLLIFLMFANVAVLYLYHDKFPELKNLPVFSFFEEKNNNSATKKSIRPIIRPTGNYRRHGRPQWPVFLKKEVSPVRGSAFPGIMTMLPNIRIWIRSASLFRKIRPKTSVWLFISSRDLIKTKSLPKQAFFS